MQIDHEKGFGIHFFLVFRNTHRIKRNLCTDSRNDSENIWIATIVRMAYNLAFQLGKMKEACRDWHKRPANNQTWPNFVCNFKAAHLDLQHEATSESAGFQAHFAEQAQLTEEFRSVTLANQTNMETLAQANLATTEQVNNLLSTITYLKNQVRTLSTRPNHPVRYNDNNRGTG